MTDDRSLFLELFPVSHGTAEKLSKYEDLLKSWNKKFNLVSESTLPLIWSRHFLDSAQLFSYLPEQASTLADMGSGAGFPGLVLAILDQEQSRGLEISCIEATGKKADFLQTVCDALELSVKIRRQRVEDIRDFKADIVTARALKALPDLLKYANYLTHKASICVFPKGRSVGEELTEARKYWTFIAEIHPSRSDPSGSVLVLKDLRYKTRR